MLNTFLHYFVYKLLIIVLSPLALLIGGLVLFKVILFGGKWKLRQLDKTLDSMIGTENLNPVSSPIFHTPQHGSGIPRRCPTCEAWQEFCRCK